MFRTDRFSEKSVISIVGGGGKTSLMFYLARSLPWHCVTTTTTKVGFDQVQAADRCGTWRTFLADPDRFAAVKVSWVSPELDTSERKISGFTIGEFRWLAAIAGQNGLPVINEADGAHCRHLKAPSEFEPVMPDVTDHVLWMMGLDVLGKPVNAENVHRTETFMEITGCEPEQEIDEALILKLIQHPLGAFKEAPYNSRKIVVLNQADTPERIARALRLAALIPTGEVDAVWVSCLKADATGAVPGILHEIDKRETSDEI